MSPLEPSKQNESDVLSDFKEFEDPRMNDVVITLQKPCDVKGEQVLRTLKTPNGFSDIRTGSG